MANNLNTFTFEGSAVRTLILNGLVNADNRLGIAHDRTKIEPIELRGYPLFG